MAYAQPFKIANGLVLDFTVDNADTANDTFLGLNSSGEVTKFATVPRSRVSGGGNITESTSSVLTITGGTGAALTSGLTIQVLQAGAGQSGYLSTTDWNTFNNKLSSSLTSTYIYVGNGSNVATGVAMSGDISITNAGNAQIVAGAIVDADVNGSASIAFSKMAALTASRILASNGSGVVSILDTATYPSLTELSYSKGVTSALQTQINSKLSVTLAGVASGDVITYNGSAWVNTPSSGTGIPSGGTTNQILRKINNTNYNVEWHTLVAADLTDITSSASELNKLTGVTTTATQFNFLNTLAGDVQSQLAAKLSTSLTQNYMFVGDASNIAVGLAPGTNGYVLTSVSGVPTWVSPGVGGTVTSVAASGGTTGMSFTGSPITTTGTLTLTGTLALANGGTGASLADPGADRIMFWDDSAGAVTWLTPGTGLSISTTNLNLTLTNGSGTTANGSAVNLGGTLTGDVNINGTDTYNVNFGNATIGEALYSFNVRTIDGLSLIANKDSSSETTLNFGGVGTSGLYLTTEGEVYFQSIGPSTLDVTASSSLWNTLKRTGTGSAVDEIGIGTFGSFTPDNIRLRSIDSSGSNIYNVSLSPTAFKILKTGSAPTVGDVWTASNVDGTGYWAPASGGGGGFNPDATFITLGDISVSNTGSVFDFDTSSSDIILTFNQLSSGGPHAQILLTPTGTSVGDFYINNSIDGTYGSMYLQTGGDMYIQAGVVGGSTNSLYLSSPVDTSITSGGDIILDSGASIKLGTSSTIGYVWTASGTDGSGGWAAPSGGAGLIVGTSTITSGTNTRVLYNNSGVLGEYTVSGSGNVAMTTSPVFTTPNIGTATGTASGNWFGTGTTTLTGAVDIVGTSSNTIKYSFASLGTTQTDGAGLHFINTTAAAAGAQQISPSIVLEGQGWKTNATAASQSVKWAMYNLPVQGAANPTTELGFYSSINGGAYTRRMYLTDAGTLTMGGSSSWDANGSLTLGTNRIIVFNGGTGTIGAEANSQIALRANASSTAIVFYRFYNTNGNYSATSGTQTIIGNETSFAPTSGTAVFNAYLGSGTINQTGGANGQVTLINLTPTITAAVSLTGFNYAPVSGSATTELAFNSTQGNWRMQGSGSNFTLGGGATASELRFLEPSGSGSSYISFKAPAMAGNTTYDLPDAYPAVSGYVLSSTTAGVMSWVASGGGGIGGSTGATDNAILRADGTGGSTVQSSAISINDSGVFIISSAAGFQISDAVTNTITRALYAEHLSSGTTAAGFGVSFGFSLENASNTGVFASDWESTWDTATAGSESSRLSLRNLRNSSNVYPITFSQRNIGLFTNAGSFGSGDGVEFMSNASTNPSTNPTDGVIRFTKDVNSASEMFVRTESGAEVNISGLLTPVTESGSSITLTESHRGKLVLCTNSGAITVTVGSGKVDGWNCILLATNATGTISLSASGTTINGVTATTAQFETLSLVHYGSEVYLSKLG